ncbi:MAG: hypothetical protein ACE5IQ_08525 [Candidatus Methylomirabilales bacterium]
MMDPVNTPTNASAPTRWLRLGIWILHVLDASVIEVRDGQYVGSI